MVKNSPASWVPYGLMPPACTIGWPVPVWKKMDFPTALPIAWAVGRTRLVRKLWSQNRRRIDSVTCRGSNKDIPKVPKLTLVF